MGDIAPAAVETFQGAADHLDEPGRIDDDEAGQEVVVRKEDDVSALVEVLEHQRDLVGRDFETSRDRYDFVVGQAGHGRCLIFDRRQMAYEGQPYGWYARVGSGQLMRGQSDDSGSQLVDTQVGLFRIFRKMLFRIGFVISDHVREPIFAGVCRRSGRHGRIGAPGGVSVHDRFAVGVRKVDEAGTGRSMFGGGLSNGQRFRIAEEAEWEPTVRVSFDMMGSRLVQQTLEDVPYIAEGHRSNELGVGADEQDRRVRGDLVESLQPHLETADVPSKQMLGSVVQLQRRQIDREQVQIDPDVPAEVVQDVVRHDERAHVTGSVVVAYFELVDLEGFRVGRPDVVSTDAAFVPQRLDQRQLPRMGFSDDGNGDVTSGSLVSASGVHRRLLLEEMFHLEMGEELGAISSDVPRSERQVEVFKVVKTGEHVDEQGRDRFDSVVADVEGGQIAEVDHLNRKTNDQVPVATQHAQVWKRDDPGDVVDAVIAEREDLKSFQSGDAVRDGAQSGTLSVAAERQQVREVSDLCRNLFQIVPVYLQHLKGLHFEYAARQARQMGVG